VSVDDSNRKTLKIARLKLWREKLDEKTKKRRRIGRRRRRGREESKPSV